MVSSNIKFSFEGNVYAQIDGLAMDSSVSVSLCEFFMGYHERRLDRNGIQLYVRYVDDTYVIGEDRQCVDSFFEQCNQLHSNLEFTREDGDHF